MSVMKKIILSGAIAGVAFAVWAFSGNRLTPSEYIGFLEDPENGLVQAKDAGGYTVNVQYKPAEYQVLKELGFIGSVASIDSACKDLRNMQAFTITLSREDGNDPLKACAKSDQEYYSLVKYFSFDAAQDIILVVGEDTIPCGFAHMERVNGISPDIKMLLSFPYSLPKGGNIQLIYADQAFNLGRLKFMFDTDRIRNLPDLKNH